MGMNKTIRATILLAALGYFVDIYDLILFSIVRVKSLKAIGIPDVDLLSTGVFLLNMQMSGMLLGGLLWGILGDKRGRLSVLLGSIFIYSLANIANGFVHDVPSYAVLRFLGGVGLAGELGAGITLVSEAMPRQTRAYGTMIVAVVGILGAIAAAFIGDLFDWRAAYWIGGGLGVGLLLLRIKAIESGLFYKAADQKVSRGSLQLIFNSFSNILKYFRCILIGIPIWFVVGILITFAPEFGRALGMSQAPLASQAVMFTYVGLAIGGLLSGCLSQLFKSRKKAIGLFMLLNAGFMLLYFFNPHPSLQFFYMVCLGLGVASGYWAVFVTVAAEQFGTNIRSTVATTVPNFVRGGVVLLTLAFQAAKNSYGTIGGGVIVAVFCVAVAFWALINLEETHGKELDYIE
jgi:putative MFS transporter